MNLPTCASARSCFLSPFPTSNITQHWCMKKVFCLKKALKALCSKHKVSGITHKLRHKASNNAKGKQAVEKVSSLFRANQIFINTPPRDCSGISPRQIMFKMWQSFVKKLSRKDKSKRKAELHYRKHFNVMNIMEAKVIFLYYARRKTRHDIQWETRRPSVDIAW